MTVAQAFCSYADDFKKIIAAIVATPHLHVRWINTLSYLENSGARKIAAYEHPILVKKETLKHAAEEFRHAYYLKQQIQKISPLSPTDYDVRELLGGTASFRYLDRLEIELSRTLIKNKLRGQPLKIAGYALITYAIELRALEIYTIYHEILREKRSPISVRSILYEEKHHLAEMENEILLLPNGKELAKQACEIEGKLCKRWLEKIGQCDRVVLKL